MSFNKLVANIPQNIWDKLCRPKFKRRMFIGFAYPIMDDQTELWNSLEEMTVNKQLAPLDVLHDWKVYKCISMTFYHAFLVLTWDNIHYVTLEIAPVKIDESEQCKATQLICKAFPNFPENEWSLAGVANEMTFRDIVNLALNRCKQMGRFTWFSNNCFEFTNAFLQKDLKFSQFCAPSKKIHTSWFKLLKQTHCS